MRYLTWATFYEGSSDALYLDVLLPRVVRDIVAREGKVPVDLPDVPAVRLGLKSREADKVADEACSFRTAFDIVFIHADTGGRGSRNSLASRSDSYCSAMEAVCSWPVQRCITVTPQHETEAWLLADGEEVLSALGYNGNPAEVGLPTSGPAAERLADPKQVLGSAIEAVAGRRRKQSIGNLFPAIAQRQRLDALRSLSSFANFEKRLRTSLRDVGCI